MSRDLVLGVQAAANATAAIAVDGRLVHCVQEERISRIKGYMGFPHQAIEACLHQVDADPADVTHIAYGSTSGPTDHLPRQEWLHRLRTFHTQPDLDRLEARLVTADPGDLPDRVRRELATHHLDHAKVTFYDHHTTHGAAAYYGLRIDPDQPYLVITCDGFGDGACATVATWGGGQRVELARTDMRNSLGLLWFWLTHSYGFVPHEDEYKLMGMAPYARPDRAAHVAALLRGHLGLDDSGLRLRRTPAHPSIEQAWPLIEQDLRGLRFDDVFAGLQRFTDDLVTAWVANAVAATGVRDVLVGGGVFMNVKTNQRVAALPNVQSFAAFPSCGDESLAIGALYQQVADLHGHHTVDPLTSCYLGDDITDPEAVAAVAGTGLRVERPADVHAAVAGLLADGRVVARAAGRMEYGARALGNRSILADPANPDLPRRLNRLIKQRDFWMPFAPAVLASQQHRYLHNPAGLPSPFMMLAFPTATGAADDMIAAVHPADLTCRPQIVHDGNGGGLADIMTKYLEATGRGVLLNTSLNLHGDPIARTAADAVDVLLRSELTHLQLGDLLISKAG